jgi:Peptidase family M23
MAAKTIIVLIVLATPVFFLLVVSWTLWKASPASKSEAMILTVVLVALCWIFGRWLMPWWLVGDKGRIAWTCLLVILILACAYKWRLLPIFRLNELWTVRFYLICCIGLGLLNWWLGYVPKAEINLHYPLHYPKLWITQGGANQLLNHHFRDVTQKYAADIIALTPYGRRAAGIFPEHLDDYVTYGLSVYAPCAGKIVAYESSRPDEQIGHADRNYPAGNYVVIECGAYSVLLAHLQPQSTPRYSVGDQVREGDSVGRIGNSGNTSEPHLHIHVVRRITSKEPGFPLSGSGVPFSFDLQQIRRGSLHGRS